MEAEGHFNSKSASIYFLNPRSVDFHDESKNFDDSGISKFVTPFELGYPP